MLAGTGGLNGRIQCQQVGLIRDIVNDANLGRDLLHRSHSLVDRSPTLRSFLASFGGHAIGYLGVVAVLADTRRHGVHLTAGLLDAGGLLARRLAQRLRRSTDLTGCTR